MSATGTALKYLLLIVALVVGGYLARHAFSEGIHTVVASQPATPKVESTSLDFGGPCKVDEHLRYINPLRCEIERRAAGDENRLVFHAKPLPTMTKAQSETAAGWFMLSAFAVPLLLAMAGLLVFLLMRSVRE